MPTSSAASDGSDADYASNPSATLKSVEQTSTITTATSTSQTNVKALQGNVASSTTAGTTVTTTAPVTEAAGIPASTVVGLATPQTSTTLSNSSEPQPTQTAATSTLRPTTTGNPDTEVTLKTRPVSAPVVPGATSPTASTANNFLPTTLVLAPITTPTTEGISIVEQQTTVQTATGALQPTETGAAQTSTNAEPLQTPNSAFSSPPNFIVPSGGIPDQPPDTELVHIGFQQPLNYNQTASDARTAAQIFTYLPDAITNSLQNGSATVRRLLPHPAGNFTQTIAEFYIPKSKEATLASDIVDGSSPLYRQKPAYCPATRRFD